MADRTKIEWTDATINPVRARRVIRSADDGLVGAGDGQTYVCTQPTQASMHAALVEYAEKGND